MVLRILRSAYAIYGALVFVIHLLLFIPFLFLGLLIFGQRSIRPLIWYAFLPYFGIYLLPIFLPKKGKAERLLHD